jgi:hypothetical protein
MTGPSHLDVWSRHHGVVYLIRGHHPLTGRVKRAYVGKTIQRPWTKRIDQHLWGRGQYQNPPQPWADTVPGWRPGGSVSEIIAAGGVSILWEGRWSPFGLWWREILLILLLRPKYNYQWNRANSSRITMTKAKNQRVSRDKVGVSFTALAGELRVLHRWLAGVALLAVGAVLLLPGVFTTVEDGVVWSWSNPLELLILVVVAGFALRSPRRALRQKRR